MATELAKAYVQIIPSAQGVKSGIEDVLGKDAAAAGDSAGKTIGSRLVGTITKVVTAAGLGKMISSALSEGADLQQSIGGIETLFKDSADTMKEYAAQAYQTAGISANDYMEQATSFAASLLQSLGGDTAAAAESANQAVIDMADNANKMGTDLESIQYAYQGFAKQNYTMLDNLKLGYGGTKEEMERLLDKAEELTGIEYDISSLDDVYQAIHVIQEDLGITGTTAKEASETFSGSMAAMKAAGKNLLANLSLGEDIGPSLSALQETVYTFVMNNLIPMLGNIISNIPQLLSGALSMAVRSMNIASNNAEEIVSQGIDFVSSLAVSIISALPHLADAALRLVLSFGEAMLTADWPGIASDLISTLQTNLDTAAGEILGTDGNIIDSVAMAIQTNLPKILQKGVETIISLATGILQALPTAIQSMGQIINSLLEYILSMVPDILEAGMELISGLAQGIIDNLPEIVNAAIDVVMDFISTLLEHLPDILETGISLLGELIAGLISSIPDLIEGAGEIIDNFIQSFKDIDWGELGSNIIDGIINGLKNGISSIVEAAKNVASSALDAAKDFLGIESPSKVMRDEVGKFIPAGIAAGIRQNISPITDAMDELTQETTETVKADMVASMDIGAKKWRSPERGYTQNITITSPEALSPYEVARQTRIATQNMVLAIRGV